MPCFGKQQCWFQHVLQPTSSQCASQPQYGAWHVFVSDTCKLHQSDQCSTATIQSAVECWECRLSIWGRMHAQSMCNLQRQHKVEGSSARKARVWWRSWSVSMAERNRWRQLEKHQVDHASWWCCGGDPRCSTSILMPCVCEKVSGGGIPARNWRSLAAKCVVQIDFAENYTCASDSILGSFVVVRVHGVKARSASNYVALVAMSSGDSSHLPEQEWAEVLHRGSKRMAGWQSRHFEGIGAAFVR